jgi:hypothetical protein
MLDHGAVVDRHSDSLCVGEAAYIATLLKSRPKYFGCAAEPWSKPGLSIQATETAVHASPLSIKTLDSHFFDGRRSPC